MAKEGDKIKTIRFGQKGVKGSPDGTARNKAFKARHAKNIAKGKMSAAYWANKTKWWLALNGNTWYTSFNNRKEKQWLPKVKTGDSIKNVLSAEKVKVTSAKTTQKNPYVLVRFVRSVQTETLTTPIGAGIGV